jgi:hypothetical protein
MQTVPARIAMVLPPKEGFSAGRVGAIGTVVHHLATSAGDALLPPLLAQVAGPPLQVPPFPDVPYHVAAPSWWPPFADNLRYAQGVVRLLRRLRPAMIEVHNRLQVARWIAAACHPTPVVLVLHNDPQTMPGAREPAQRGRLLHRFARIVCVSDYIRRRWMDGVAPQNQAAPLVMINPINFTDLPAPPATRDNLILFVGRVVPENPLEQQVRGRGEAHGRAGVPRSLVLYCVHGQDPDQVHGALVDVRPLELVFWLATHRLVTAPLC